MSTINQIEKTLANELKVYRKVFRESVKSSAPLLDIIMKYILRTKGKQMRPLTVLVSAGMLGEINDSTYRAAAMIELLHTATLVHDDIVDESDRRRGMFSVNALWKNKIAVLAGDYLLSRGMLLALNSKDYHTLEIVSEAVKEMSEGELLQIEKARRLDIDEEVYYDVIRKKTASLLASCFAVGAASVTDDKEIIDQMWKAGELTGMAFQIKDDILDFERSSKKGKPTGIDIKEKKMTLPLIYLINNSRAGEKREIIRTIKRYNKDERKVNALIDKVASSGGLAYAEKVMNEYSSKALSIIDGMPDNVYSESLKEIILYSANRNK